MRPPPHDSRHSPYASLAAAGRTARHRPAGEQPFPHHRTPARLLRASTALAVSLALSACSGGARTRFSPLDSDGRHLRDPQGRAVLLRGVNARVEGVFDVTLDGGRVPLEEIPAFEASDAQRMAELGFNLLRLPINWSALEPTRGSYSLEYLERIATTVELCRREGVLVLLDMHQDAYSKEIGEDGAPLWAIEPPPTQLLEGPLTDLAERRISKQVLDAFETFFTEGSPLQTRFAEAFTVVARRFADSDAILGYELFNEPQTDDALLVPFHTQVAAAIRTVDTRHLIAFEPGVFRNFLDSSPLSSRPFAEVARDAGGLYAPHIYTGVFAGTSLEDNTFAARLDESWSNARDEAVSWGVPLLVGEFGVGPTTPNGFDWLARSFDAADRVLASTAFWLWKEIGQGDWGLFDHTATGSWVERPAMVAATSRPYARAIGGDPESVAWSGGQLTLRVRERAGVPDAHELFFPGGPVEVRCNGATTTARPLGRDLFEVRCSGQGLNTVELTRR